MSERNAIRVLIVDDNDLTRSLLRVILRSAEYDVVGEAMTAQGGLEMAKLYRPQVILLDHNMPNGNGLDIIQPLHNALPEAVILMVTTQNDERVINGAIERGANGFVIKPFNTDTVLGTIKKATRQFVLAQPAKLLT